MGEPPIIDGQSEIGRRPKKNWTSKCAETFKNGVETTEKPAAGGKILGLGRNPPPY